MSTDRVYWRCPKCGLTETDAEGRHYHEASQGTGGYTCDEERFRLAAIALAGGTASEVALASARAEGAREERERMAQLAQDAADNHSCGSWDCHVDEVVAAIRARGTK